EERRQARGSPPPPNDEQNYRDDRRDPHQPAVSLAALIDKDPDPDPKPRAQGAEHEQRAHQAPEQEPTAHVGGPKTAHVIRKDSSRLAALSSQEPTIVDQNSG